MIDTTERVCPKCCKIGEDGHPKYFGSLSNIVNRLNETDWLCDNCNTKFTVPNLKDWENMREVRNNEKQI